MANTKVFVLVSLLVLLVSLLLVVVVVLVSLLVLLLVVVLLLVMFIIMISAIRTPLYGTPGLLRAGLRRQPRRAHRAEVHGEHLGTIV